MMSMLFTIASSLTKFSTHKHSCSLLCLLKLVQPQTITPSNVSCVLTVDRHGWKHAFWLVHPQTTRKIPSMFGSLYRLQKGNIILAAGKGICWEQNRGPFSLYSGMGSLAVFFILFNLSLLSHSHFKFAQQSTRIKACSDAKWGLSLTIGFRLN